MFAEVILPLPLGTTFSYIIPDDMLPHIAAGQRVIVPFGKKKYYTGIVLSILSNAPHGVDVKEIALLLDAKPVVRHPQTRIWQWIADYYLCPVGDVYKAAVPAGLKIESDTFVELNPDYDMDESNPLSDAEASVIALLSHNKDVRVTDIEREIKSANVARLVEKMLDRGLIIISEQLVEKYRARVESYVEPAFSTPIERKTAFDAVSGARKQEQMLMSLLVLCQSSTQVTVAQLLEKSGCSRAILKALCDKGVARIVKQKINRFSFNSTATKPLPVLTEAQLKALRQVNESFSDRLVTLLHGVTSSGKTEIYMHLIAQTLERRLGVLLLVPEIALTTQLTGRLQECFGSKVLIYHSKFSDNERVDLWRYMLDHTGDPYIVLGTRTSLFMPFDKLGLVIVDEEHDTSYKQFDPSPRYNARDVAVVLASNHGAKVLMGTATPSIETYYKALTGKFGLVRLTERYGNAQLPEIKVIDTSQARKKKQMSGTFATETIEHLRNTIADGHQAIVFRNKRGYAPQARCSACAHIPKCDNCDVALTYHKFLNRLVCHYCGATYPMPSICPQCHEPGIEIIGYGTERVEDEVKELFEKARITRMDLDTTRNKNSYLELIDEFSEHKTNMLIGTQMVAKGLDFKDVRCVAVLSADGVINLPDFRSGERAFNMLEQVAGRAGRVESADGKPGTVLIQTMTPDHPVIGHLVNHDYEAHFQSEIEDRQRYMYPPFSRIIYIYLRHKDPRKLDALAKLYADSLRARLGNRVFGPEEPAVARVNLMYIRKIMLKIEPTASITRVREVLEEIKSYVAARDTSLRPGTMYYDVDPV